MTEDEQDGEQPKAPDATDASTDSDASHGLARREFATAVAGMTGLAGCLGAFGSDQSQPQSDTPSGDDISEAVPSIVVWQDTKGVIHAEAGRGQIRAGRRPAAIIQAAINESAKKPGVHSVEVIGNYTVSQPVQLKPQTILNLRNARLATDGDQAAVAVNGISNAAIIGGVLDGDSQSDGEKYLGVLALNGADHVVVDSCDVRNGGYYGVNLYECNNCLLSGVRSRGNYRHGIHPGSDTADRGYFNWLIQCVTDSNGVDGVNDRGTTVSGESLNNAFYNCLSRNNGRSGFILAGGVEAEDVATRYDVIGCRSYQNKSHGMQFTNCRASAVNVVSQANGRSGIRLEGGVRASVLNPRTNDHRGSDAAGIAIENGDSVSPKHVVIYGGESTGNTQNIQISVGSDAGPLTVRDVDIRNAVEQPIVFTDSYPSDLTISDTPGYRTTNRGEETNAGDGSTTTFRWPHYLALRPKFISVTPATPAAAAPFSATAENGEVVVTYQNSPPQGDNNLQWWWEARAY